MLTIIGCGNLNRSDDAVGVIVAQSLQQYLTEHPYPNVQVADDADFSGKRVSRSWYTASDGSKIHADVNGAFNIGRKVISMSFDCLKSIVQRDRGCLVVHPRRITPVFPSSLGSAQALLKAKVGGQSLCL